MTGPVMYTLKFLKNWLTRQIASIIAVTVIGLVFIFIDKTSFKFSYEIILLWGCKCKVTLPVNIYSESKNDG